MTILVQHWHPESLAPLFPAIRAEALTNWAVCQVTARDLVAQESYRDDLCVIACLSAKPHRDYQSPRYCALWIMQSGGHMIGVRGTVPGDPYNQTARRPTRRVEYEAVEGEIALLDTHRVHWLRPGDGVFAAVGWETGEMPTVEEVEARFAVLGGV